MYGSVTSRETADQLLFELSDDEVVQDQVVGSFGIEETTEAPPIEEAFPPHFNVLVT